MANAREVVIVNGARTAIGDYGGSLKDIPPRSSARASFARPWPARGSTRRKSASA